MLVIPLILRKQRVWREIQKIVRDSTEEEPAEEPWLKLIIHLSPSLLSLRKGGFCLMLTQY